MIEQMNHIPAPRPVSLILIGVTLFFNHISKLNHSEVTMYISNVAGMCAFIHYLIVFIKWLMSKKKATKP